MDERLKHADAAVISTGTQTMEELAYWLDLTVRSPKPIVVTGAMRPWNVIGSDGPANLYNAVALAASRRTRCFGSVVMLNDEIDAARDATKTSTTGLDTFQSPELGELGTIDETQIRLLRAPARVVDCGDLTRWRTPFDLAAKSRDRLPRVGVVYTPWTPASSSRRRTGTRPAGSTTCPSLERVRVAPVARAGVSSRGGLQRSRSVVLRPARRFVAGIVPVRHQWRAKPSRSSATVPHWAVPRVLR